MGTNRKAKDQRKGTTTSIRFKRLDELLAKEKYYDAVLSSNTSYSASEIANDFGKTAEWLHKFLQEKKVIKNVNGIWLLTAKYCGKGYTDSRTMLYSDANNEMKTKIVTAWTEKGRVLIWDLLYGDAKEEEKEDATA